MILEEDVVSRTEFEGRTYDSRHGGAFDRGSADSWYSRPRRPHLFLGGSYQSVEIGARDMTQEQVDSYMAGYDYNERYGGKKDWD
jgi:hypothetical protein